MNPILPHEEVGKGEYVLPSGITKTVLLIAGMRGNRCREKIAAALESVAGVKDVAVNLYRAQVTIKHDPLCDSAELIQAVLEAGYGASLIGDECGSGSLRARNGQGWR